MKLNLMVLIGILVIVSSNADAQSFRIEPAVENPRVLAGEINSEGLIVKGKGFTVAHPRAGHFVIHFEPGIFPEGCPIVTATPAFWRPNPPLVAVYQSDKLKCDHTFEVLLSWAGSDVYTDRPFTFIAVGT